MEEKQGPLFHIQKVLLLHPLSLFFIDERLFVATSGSYDVHFSPLSDWLVVTCGCARGYSCAPNHISNTLFRIAIQVF